MKNIYSLITEIDKKIKEEKLFLTFSYRNIEFNFQDKESKNYCNYSPFSVDKRDLYKVLKILFAPADSEIKNSKFTRHTNNYEASVNWVKINNEVFHILNDKYVSSPISESFLYTGVYLITTFLSERGRLVLAAYSYSFPPQIFETKIKGIDRSKKQKFSNTFFNTLHSGIKSIIIDESIQNVIIKIPFRTQEHNGRQLRNFLSENSKLILDEENDTLKVTVKLISEFCWDKTLTCIENLSTIYFNDTDMNIFKRADLVAYLIQNFREIEKQLPLLEESKKYKILSVFEKNKDYFNLFTQSIDLNQNKFYKKIPKEKIFYDDYGAELINSLNSFLKLQIMLKEEKIPVKRNKI